MIVLSLIYRAACVYQPWIQPNSVLPGGNVGLVRVGWRIVGVVEFELRVKEASRPRSVDASVKGALGILTIVTRGNDYGEREVVSKNRYRWSVNTRVSACLVLYSLLGSIPVWLLQGTQHHSTSSR